MQSKIQTALNSVQPVPLHPWIQPTIRFCNIIVVILEKKSTHKWTCAIQTCVVRVSTVLDILNVLFLLSLYTVASSLVA